jgi:predicted secreted protein
MASSLNKYPGYQMLVQVELAGSPGTFNSIGGIDTNGFTVNQEAVDITDKQAMPWRTLLPATGIVSMSVKGSGFVTGDAIFKQLLAQLLQTTTQTFMNFKLVSGAGDVLKGTFQITSMDRNGDKNAAEKFSISLESSGPIAFTPAP